MANIAITRGETKPINLYLVTPAGAAHDITGQTRVLVAIGTARTASPTIERDTDSDNSTLIEVTASPAQIIVHLTDAESQALAIRNYVVDVFVELNSVWIAAEACTLTVLEPVVDIDSA